MATIYTITSNEAASIALQAFAWIMSEDDIRDRFLDLSGLSSDELAEQIERRGFQIAILDFLLQHEPDLLAFADATEISPTMPMQAKQQLAGPEVAWT